MQMTVRFSGGHRADFGQHDYEGILLDSLQRFRERVEHVHLYIEDVNGPRGGVDKQCRCIVHLRRMPPIVVEDQDENMFAMLHRVANRAAYAVSQKADRRAKRVKQNRGDRRQQLLAPFPNLSEGESNPVVDIFETT